MNKPTGSDIRVASPLKAWASRFALLLLVGAAFGLMLIGRTNTFIVEETRSVVTDMVTPILDAGGALVGIDSDLSQRNQTRYDDYFRIDMRLSRTVDLHRGSFQFYVEIFNLLNTSNECCVSGHDLTVGPPLTAAPSYDVYLPFFPSFGFVWTFGPGVG